MPICSVGQTVTLSVQVEILKAFAHEDRVYYIARPLKSLANTIWIVSTDGEPLEVSREILAKAYRTLGRMI